jgi:hypothetical protein
MGESLDGSLASKLVALSTMGSTAFGGKPAFASVAPPNGVGNGVSIIVNIIQSVETNGNEQTWRQIG